MTISFFASILKSAYKDVKHEHAYPNAFFPFFFKKNEIKMHAKKRKAKEF